LGNLPEYHYTILITSRSVLLRMENFSKFRENRNTHFIVDNVFFFSKILPFMM